MMHGMFRSNGGCGYIRKPDFLMNKGPNDEVFDPKAALPVKKTLKVEYVNLLFFLFFMDFLVYLV